MSPGIHNVNYTFIFTKMLSVYIDDNKGTKKKRHVSVVVVEKNACVFNWMKIVQLEICAINANSKIVWF